LVVLVAEEPDLAQARQGVVQDDLLVGDIEINLLADSELPHERGGHH
jgi:hypothetical protein